MRIKQVTYNASCLTVPCHKGPVTSSRKFDKVTLSKFILPPQRVEKEAITLPNTPVVLIQLFTCLILRTEMFGKMANLAVTASSMSEVIGSTAYGVHVVSENIGNVVSDFMASVTLLMLFISKYNSGNSYRLIYYVPQVILFCSILKNW